MREGKGSVFRIPKTGETSTSQSDEPVLNMNIKKALQRALEEKQVDLFEKKQRGDRKTDRHYVQVVSTIDELKRDKKHDTTRRKNSRQTN